MSPLTVGLLALASILPERETPLPPLALANGLCSHATACALERAANDYWGYASERYGAGSKECNEAHRWWLAWWNIRQATSPYCTIHGRRLALYYLVRDHGWRAVVTGEIPCPAELTKELR